MKSHTKLELSPETIRTLFRQGGIGEISSPFPLGNGEFNSVYAADCGGKSYALKIAPLSSRRILSYEKNMMAQEIYYYGLMRESGIRVPEVYYSDFSCTAVATPFFIMERLEGEQMDLARLNRSEKQDARRKLASMAAMMHAQRGEGFGYRQNGLQANWYLALQSMVSSLMEDARRLGRSSRNGETLLNFIELNRDTLMEVESRLINFDIWPANILCRKEKGEVKLAWIDPERCLWGDRIADFVCLDFNIMSLKGKREIRSMYNVHGDQQITDSKDEEIRYYLMLSYLGLIMEVEKYARYSRFHFGYWRNVIVCRKIFSTSFPRLRKLSP